MLLFLQEFAKARGIPVDTITTGIALLGNYPLALLFTQVPQSYKHMFSILCSAISFCVLFDPLGFLQLLTLALLCYFILKFHRQHTQAPIWIFVLSMGTLSAKYFN
jgi:hypothetical protein